MCETKELILNKLELQTILGLDLGVFLENDEYKNTFNSLRGNRQWLGCFLQGIKLSQQHDGFTSPEFTSSSYARTEKRERSTFSTYYDETLMPLSFPIIDDKPLFLSEHNISIKLQTIRIGVNGSVTLTSGLSYDGYGLSYDTFIKEYNTNLSRRIKEKAYLVIGKLIETLNLNMFTNLKFNYISYAQFEQFIYCFNVIDFDYTISKEMNIFDLCEDDDFLKQLVRIFRMSLNNYQNSDINRIKKLLDDNIGYRKDELWLINENRIVRHYPEVKDKSKELFFDDVVLGCEILVQHKVSLLYLNQWVITKYSKIKKAINSHKHLASKNLNEIESVIFEMVNFINIFSDDFYVQMNINHSFFNEIMKQLIKKLDLMPILKSNRELLSSLLEHLSSISSILTTDKSIKTNKMMWGITIIMTVVAILQLIVTYLTLVN